MNPLPGVPRNEKARLLAYILAFLLTFSLPLGLLFFHSGLVLLNRDQSASTLAEIASESPLLPKALAWFATSRAEQFDAVQALTTQPRTPEIGPILKSIPEDGWRQIGEALAMDEMLMNWSYRTYDAVSQWLVQADELPVVIWNLETLRTRLQSDQGRIVIAIAFASLPPCTEGQLQAFEARLRSAPPGQDVLYEPCQHPPPWYQDQFDAYIGSLGRVSAAISDTFNLTAALQTAEDPLGVGVGTLKLALQFLLLGAFLAPMVSLTLLLMVRYLIGPVPFELGKTIGVALTFGGAIAMLLSTAYRPVIESSVAGIVLSEVPDAVQLEAILAISRLSQPVFSPIRLEGVILLLCGFLVMIWGAAVFKRSPHAVSSTEPRP